MKFKNQASLLTDHRLAANVSQVELADALGICGQSISNIERGIAPIPPFHVKAICSTLNKRSGQKKLPKDYLQAFLADSEIQWWNQAKHWRG